MHDSKSEQQPVSFKAQLIGIGDAAALAEDIAALGHQDVIVFLAADVEEARKASRLFRRNVVLTAGEP